MSTEINFTLNSSNIRRFKTTANGKSYIEERNSNEFFQELSKRSLIDTGIMPSGVLSVKQCGQDLQIAIVAPPSKNLLIWGQSEGSASAETYLLAQPYRLIVGEFRDGAFLGARMFYSPVPITSVDNVLYHANVPNLNCKGYRGTGVGWVCLYQNHDTTRMTIAEKAAYIGLRCSGNEAYNDENMSETDGPRFYESKGYPVYTYDPAQWEAKTEIHGIDWTLDPAMWLPILVASAESQEAHYEHGVPLTVGMVLDGRASYYYTDEACRLPRSFTDFDVDSIDIYHQIFNASFNAAAYLGVKEIVETPQPVIIELPHGISFSQEESSDSTIVEPGHDHANADSELAAYSMQQLFDATLSPNKSAVIGLSSMQHSGFNYSFVDQLEVGETVEDAYVITYIYRNGVLVSNHESKYVSQLGMINGQANHCLLQDVHYSAVMELMFLRNEQIWPTPPVLSNFSTTRPSAIPIHAYAKNTEFPGDNYDYAMMIAVSREENEDEEYEEEE